MNERHVGGLLAVFTVCIIFAFYVYQQAGGAARARQALDQAAALERKKAEDALKRLCHRVTGECEASASVLAEHCDQRLAKVELEKLLGNPIRQAGCEDLEKNIASNCTGPCEYSSASLLLFAGKLIVDPPGPKQSDGRCEVHARKPMTASAQCVPKAGAVADSPQ